MTDDPQPTPTKSAKVTEAFAANVAMRPERSLRSQATMLAEQADKTSTTGFPMLKEWSVTYRWRERIAAAVTE